MRAALLAASRWRERVIAAAITVVAPVARFVWLALTFAAALPFAR
jgi:hypothetical protein